MTLTDAILNAAVSVYMWRPLVNVRLIILNSVAVVAVSFGLRCVSQVGNRQQTKALYSFT